MIQDIGEPGDNFDTCFGSRVLIVIPPALMQLIRLLLKNSGWLVVVATITGLLAGASSAGLIASINFALQRLDQLPPWLPWLFLGLCSVLMVTYTLSQVVLTSLAQDVVYTLRLQLTRRILDCPLQHLEQLGAPKLLATLTEDVEAIAASSAFISILCTSTSLVLGCLVYLCWLSPLIFLLMVVFLVCSFYLLQFFMAWGQRIFMQARDVQDQLFQHFQVVTSGTKELKLHYARRQIFLAEDLTITATQLRTYWLKGMTVFALVGGVGFALTFIPVGFLLFVLPQFITISPAILTSYALTILFLITPLDGVLRALPQFSRANVALAKVETLGLSLVSQTTENLELSAVTTPLWQHWELQEVVHTYTSEGDHSFTLGPLSLQLKPGEIVFVVGGNGSGKSTLVKLLTGLYEPDSGQILFEGEEVCDRNREQYRQNFSVVFADFYLFDRFLGLDESKAQGYLQKLELDHKVKIEAGQLSTVNLSQGQRKRLALLTAYLEDRPIYVFDEWASDQDPVFKEVFYSQLLPALKQQGKTVIVVSHDDRYFEYCDRIIKLDYGQIQSDQSV